MIVRHKGIYSGAVLDLTGGPAGVETSEDGAIVVDWSSLEVGGLTLTQLPNAPMPLRIAQGEFLFNGTHDWVWNIGYNNSSDASGRADNTKIGWVWQLESHYQPTADPTVVYAEGFLQYTAIDGTVIRPLGCILNHAVQGSEAAYISAVGNFQVYTQNASLALFQVRTNGEIWIEPTCIGMYRRSNDTPYLQQLNAARDGYVEALRVDSADRVSLGQAGASGVRVHASGSQVLDASASAIDISVPLELPVYTVATVPSASVSHRLIAVSDGNAGQPCLAVSDGADWRRVALGAAVSVTLAVPLLSLAALMLSALAL